jgi:7-carboxy-7-deazaguanine synthase
MQRFPICETFCSLQGEGLLAGMPAFFIRISGCNLHCIWCDTPYASRPTEPPLAYSLDTVMSMLREHASIQHVVVTGGEPMLCADLPALTEALATANRHITIETNGTLLPGSVTCDLASLSPKLPGSQPDGKDAIDVSILNAWCDSFPCQLKFVVGSDDDVTAAEAVITALTHPPPPEQIFLMPCAVTEEEQLALTPWLTSVCRETGLRYGHRLQLTLYGNQRGT